MHIISLHTHTLNITDRERERYIYIYTYIEAVQQRHISLWETDKISVHNYHCSWELHQGSKSWHSFCTAFFRGFEVSGPTSLKTPMRRTMMTWSNVRVAGLGSAGNVLGMGGKVAKLIVDRMSLIMFAIMLADVRGQGFQWKADVRSLVRNFAEEHRAMVLCLQGQFKSIWETDLREFGRPKWSRRKGPELLVRSWKPCLLQQPGPGYSKFVIIASNRVIWKFGPWWVSTVILHGRQSFWTFFLCIWLQQSGFAGASSRPTRAFSHRTRRDMTRGPDINLSQQSSATSQDQQNTITDLRTSLLWKQHLGGQLNMQILQIFMGCQQFCGELFNTQSNRTSITHTYVCTNLFPSLCIYCTLSPTYIYIWYGPVFLRTWEACATP